MSDFSDLDVYRRLSGMAEELDRMAATSSLVSGTALRTASATLRGIASAIYDHALSEGDDD